MKIVDRDTFIGLPKGTVYMEYQHGKFGPLSFKATTVPVFGGDQLPNFMMTSITTWVNENPLVEGEVDQPLYVGKLRQDWTMDSDVYAILSVNDLEGIRSLINTSLDLLGTWKEHDDIR